MNAKDSLALQYGMMYGIVGMNVGGMTQEHSLAQPPSGGNCANWILGHLTNVQNGVMKLAGGEPVWESDQLARAGFDPITGKKNAIEWDTLRDKFLGSKDRCLAAIAALSDAKLAEAVPHPFGGTCSRAELLFTLAVHQSYHAGQLAIARRVAGLDGVIKAPGQVEAEAARGR